MAPNAHFRVLFPQPGWFLTDVRLEIQLDGAVIYDGGFLAGVDVVLEVPPGSHLLETAIHLAGLRRSKQYRFEVAAAAPDGGALRLEARLRYSRLWGNFTSKLQLGPP